MLAPNVPALLEAHYAVPMAGAVLNALNYRLDAHSIAFILDHGGAKLLLADREFAPLAAEALRRLRKRPAARRDRRRDRRRPPGAVEYEDFLAEGDPAAEWSPPEDEWSAIALNYTSGTTGNPKGVVFHHRGAYLNAIGNAITFGLDRHSVYLWTLPMFHCNGWTYTWGVTAVAGTHVCLRRVEPAAIFDAIAAHRVTHLCGAPIVLNMLVHAPDYGEAPLRPCRRGRDRRRRAALGRDRGDGADGVPRHPSLWSDRKLRPVHGLRLAGGMEELPLGERAGLMARQGVAYLTLDAQRVADPETIARRAGRRHDDRRIAAAQQHGHEGLSEKPGRDR